MTDKIDNGQLLMNTNSNAGVTNYNLSDSNCPKVAIIILNWNGWQDTIECLESLQRITYPNYQVIVIDNGSTDGSIEKIKAWAKGEIPVESKFFEYKPDSKPVQWIEYAQQTAEAGGIPEEAKLAELPVSRRIILIQTEENLGFAGGNNVGIKYALTKNADYVFILNNDTVIEVEALTEMVQVTMKQSEIAMVAPVVLNYWAPDFVDRLGIVLTMSGMGFDRKHEKDGPLLCPSGVAALYSRSMLLSVVEDGEFFDEGLFMYCEDMDICFRAAAKGFKASLASSSIVFYKGGSSLSGQDSPESVYFVNRNTIWFISKNYPISFLFKYGLWIILGQIGGFVKNIGRKRLQYVWQGKLDGLKGVRDMQLKRSKRNVQPKCGAIPMSKKPFIVIKARSTISDFCYRKELTKHESRSIVG